MERPADREVLADLSREPTPGYWHRVWKKLLNDKVSVICMIVLLSTRLPVLFAPLLTPCDPAFSSVMNRLKPVGTEGHILGTDELGRDMATRLLYGGRLLLLMGMLPVAHALLKLEPWQALSEAGSTC